MDLYNGDCIEVMKKLPDNSVDAVICDPPYGTTQCKWDVIIPFEDMWEQLNRIGKETCPFVLFGSEPFSSHLRLSNLKNYKYDWIWEKSKSTNFLNAKIQPLRCYENISVFYRNKSTYNPQMQKGLPYDKGIRKKQSEEDIYGNFSQVHVKSDLGLRYPRNLIYFKTAESEGKTYHKTQKPVALIQYLIKTYTNEGDTVLDFTAGSFTTGVACVNLNRKFIGIEMDKDYFDIGLNRIKEHIKCLDLKIELEINMEG